MLKPSGRSEPVFIDAAPAERGWPQGPRTLASGVYVRLRKDVLNCRYQPGEKLLIGVLAKHFAVSSAAVREALSRLVADGLVVAEDQRGFRVSPLSLADLRDLTDTRIELECLALRRSIERGDAEWRRALQEAWQSLESVPRLDEQGCHTDAWAARHMVFHKALVAACGLEWLLRFRATLYEQSERYRRLSLGVAPEGRDIEAEHRAIVEAALAGDSAQATAALMNHIEMTTRNIQAAYPDSNGSDVLSWAKAELMA